MQGLGHAADLGGNGLNAPPRGGIFATTLLPALRHAHTDEGRMELSAGMCAGFKAGTGNAHQLSNESTTDAVYLEVGNRTPGDEVIYPDDDLVAHSENGAWKF